MKTIFVLFSFCFFPFVLFAQEIGSMWELQNTQRVKVLDEFWQRFNGTHNLEGKRIAYDSAVRQQALAGLFDRAYVRQADSALRQVLQRFVRTLAPDSSQILAYHDSDWYAELHCKATLKGKPENLKLLMQTAKTPEGYAKWTIRQAESGRLGLKAQDTTLALTPVSHNLNFMQVARLSKENRANIAALAHAEYAPDPLSIFFYLVKSGELQIDYVEKITYHFLQIPNYIFTVEHFERAGNNVGWLISSVQAADSKQKAAYRRKLGL